MSAEGISLTGLLIETVSYTVTMLYNYVNGYAMLSYLEYPILMVQEYILVYYVLLYKGLLGDQKMKISIVVYWILFVLFALRLAPGWILLMLLPFTTPASATSKILQILAIVKSQDSESISLMTWFISAFTNGGSF